MPDPEIACKAPTAINASRGKLIALSKLSWLTLFLGAVTLLLGIAEISASLPLLLDRFLPDDAFYYFKPALNFATAGFSSFDGIHFTNGYQPLWFLVLVPVFALFPNGVELPLRLALLIQVLLATLSTALLVRSTGKLFGLIPAAIAGVGWIFWFQSSLINGLETALLMCLYIGLFGVYASFIHKPALTARDAALLGLLSALVFLARTDSVFLVAAIGAALLLDRRARSLPRAQASRFLLVFALPVALLAGGYLLTNLLTTGHILPVSGAVKIYYSQLARNHAVQETGASLIKIYLTNLFWVFVYRGYYYIFLGVAIFILAALASLLPRVRRYSQPLLEFWPFYLGGITSYAYYSLVYYGSFTRTVWYYAPATFLTCLSLAWAAYTLQELLKAKHLLAGKRTHRAALVSGLGVLIFVAAVLPALKLGQDLTSKPHRWNYNLLLGARWARQYLPEDATIWSGSAGILGYFSRRRVVNTDGLVNDYSFLEQVLKKDGLDGYVSQWDYAIDAFPEDDQHLQAAFPEGCFVPLPEEFVSSSFQDGSYTRRLAVYQMKAQGVVDCNKLRAEGSQTSGFHF